MYYIDTTLEYVIAAVSVGLLAVSLVVGLSAGRRPSISVELGILALVVIHFVLMLFLIYQTRLYTEIRLRLAFIPLRFAYIYGPTGAPGGAIAYLWSPFTYALLHANGWHLFSNGLALFIFGRTVAWRLGAAGFYGMFALSALAGAALHFLFYFYDPAPVVGASAAAFGIMGATFRFVPGVKDMLQALFWPDAALRDVPIIGMWSVLSHRRSLTYVLICFLVFPLGVLALFTGNSGDVAVMGHVGGLAFGYFGFGFFDRRRPVTRGAGPVAVSQPETRGPKLLRALAVVMLVVGMAMGLLGYYFQLF